MTLNLRGTGFGFDPSDWRTAPLRLSQAEKDYLQKQAAAKQQTGSFLPRESQTPIVDFFKRPFVEESERRKLANDQARLKALYDEQEARWARTKQANPLNSSTWNVGENLKAQGLTLPWQESAAPLVKKNKNGTYDLISAGDVPDLTGGVFKGPAAKSFWETGKVLRNQFKSAAGGRGAIQDAIEAGTDLRPINATPMIDDPGVRAAINMEAAGAPRVPNPGFEEMLTSNLKAATSTDFKNTIKDAGAGVQPPTSARVPILEGPPKPPEPPKPPVATGAVPPKEPRKPVDALKKLEQSLQDAYDIQKGKRSTELGKRVFNARQGIDVNDPDAIKKSLGALSGKMPVERMKFTNPLTDAEWDDIRLQINPHAKTGNYFDALHARDYVDAAQAYLMGLPDATPPPPHLKEAFKKLFPDSKIPSLLQTAEDLDTPFTGKFEFPEWNNDTSKQLAMFPPSARDQFTKTLKAAGNQALDIGDLLRTVQASFDVSFSMRQGLIASLRHPVAGAKSFARGLRGLASQNYADAVEHVMKTDPDAMRFIKDGGYLAPLDPATVSRTMREEGIASKWAQKIPGIKASSRSFTTAANTLRLDVAKQGYKLLDAARATENDYKEFAKFVNIITGRGNLPASMQKTASVLNSTLFSPRLMMSRLQLPTKLASSSPFVRKEAAKSLAALIGFTASVLGVSALMGGKVETDPRSAAFGKLRIGDTYYDITGGNVQYFRTLARLATGKIKQPGGDIADKSRLETIVQFLQSKESPLFSFVTDLLAGETYGGEKLEPNLKTVKDQVVQRLAPLVVQDVVNGLVEEGFVGGAKALPGAVGVGQVTYPEPPPAVAFPQGTDQQIIDAIRKELSDTKTRIGRGGEKIGALTLDDDDTREYQRLAGESVGQALIARTSKPDYAALPDYEKGRALAQAANQAKEDARVQFIIKSGITLPHDGDDKATAQARKDLGRVSQYLQAMAPVTNEDAKTVIGNILRASDPGLDVALRLNGYDRNSKAATPASDAFYSERKNGAIKDYPSTFNTATASTLVKMISPYYDIDRYVWSQYPTQAKTLAEQIDKLENGTDAQKYQAKVTLRTSPYGPSILQARKMVATYRAMMRRQNQLLDYYLSNFRS